MSVLTAVQRAARLLGTDVPTLLYASTSAYQVELQEIAQEAATAIAKFHDWRLLTTLKTQAGDGASTSFSLPTDYDRMPVNAKVYLTSAQVPLSRVEDINQWMDLSLRSWVGTVGWWFIIGGTMNVLPAVGATDSFKYYYQSNLVVSPSDTGAGKARFTADSDTFLIDERLLELEIIWRWRSYHGWDYAREKAESEMAITQEANRDKGARIIKIGRPFLPSGVTLAYPGTISE